MQASLKVKMAPQRSPLLTQNLLLSRMLLSQNQQRIHMKPQPTVTSRLKRMGMHARSIPRKIS